MSEREKELYGIAKRHQLNLNDPASQPSAAQKAEIKALFERNKYFGFLTPDNGNTPLDAALARLVSTY